LKNFFYYCWMQKPICIGYWVIRPKKGRSQLTHMNYIMHTLQFILTTCTNEIHINLEWGDFLYFHVLITSVIKQKSCALQIYLDLTNFMISLFLYKKKRANMWNTHPLLVGGLGKRELDHHEYTCFTCNKIILWTKQHQTRKICPPFNLHQK
jgi:hypothetical protein